MKLDTLLAEGKTKVVYAHPSDPALAVLAHKDGITAGDGARRSVIAGKGALAGRTAANVFALLARAGLPTHFVDAPEPTLAVVRRCAMIPIEAVTRRLATGSYLRRNPAVAEGQRFDPPLVEFFLKDDARHDPLIAPEAVAADGIATPEEVARLAELAQQTFAVLERAWAAQGVTLVDLKIECGRPAAPDTQHSALGTQQLLLVADVIDNDSWRIWPDGDKARMLDKQVYRNAQHVDDAVLDEVRRRYEAVADLTDRFAALPL